MMPSIRRRIKERKRQIIKPFNELDDMHVDSGETKRKKPAPISRKDAPNKKRSKQVKQKNDAAGDAKQIKWITL